MRGVVERPDNRNRRRRPLARATPLHVYGLERHRRNVNEVHVPVHAAVEAEVAEV